MLEQTKPACVWNTFSKFLSTKIMSNCKLLISNNTIKIKSNLLFGLYEREGYSGKKMKSVEEY